MWFEAINLEKCLIILMGGVENAEMLALELGL